MCETIQHRGPDSEGIWMDDSVALGMRRLSIIDLHTGDQPVYSEDKTVIAMINEAREQGAAIVGIFHDDAVRDDVADRRYDVTTNRRAA